MSISDNPREARSAYVLVVPSGSDAVFLPLGFEVSLEFQNQSTSEIVCKPILNAADRAAGTNAGADGMVLGAAAAGTKAGPSMVTRKICEWRFRSLGANNVNLYVFPQE